jgi:hypothetical protein
VVRALKARRKKDSEEQKNNIGYLEEGVINELENKGDLKKDVPVGVEEFESEEPRQGE